MKRRRGVLTLDLSYIYTITDITEIEGLETLTDLQHLNLEHNQITEIKGLEKLTNLQVLNLKHNQITEINGLEKLTNLQILNLEQNPIYSKLEKFLGLQFIKRR